jgi:hypothetical protein
MQSSLIQYFTNNPLHLFLTDAVGAFVTSISWLVWKLHFAEQFKFQNYVLSGLIFMPLHCLAHRCSSFCLPKKISPNASILSFPGMPYL